MRLLHLCTLICAFNLISIHAQAQLDALFAPFDCRPHAEFFHEVPIEETIDIDSSLLIVEEPISIDTVNTWQHWHTVENHTFGKNRGELTMIADLNALHPYFRDRIQLLIKRCEEKGITLAVVETYRTHTKQSEYKTMGKKYTMSGAGKSKHQYGLAADVVPIVDSVAVWDNPVLWKKIGVIGEQLGLRWGGRWRKPYDPVHFEWTGGLTTTQLSMGMLPPVPQADSLYPCLETDLQQLKRYWSAWETTQSALTRK